MNADNIAVPPEASHTPALLSTKPQRPGGVWAKLRGVGCMVPSWPVTSLCRGMEVDGDKLRNQFH